MVRRTMRTYGGCSGPAGCTVSARVDHFETAAAGSCLAEATRALTGGPMLAYLDVHIGWRELFKRTVRETLKDDAQGLAAQLA